MSPSEFGPYRVEREVGRGGMGVVFKAVDPRRARPVALKVPLDSLSETQRRRFLREGRALAQVRHPNVVAILDLGEQEGRPYLVLEWVEGENLGELVQQRGALPLREAVEIGTGLAAALSAVHALGLAHRDVKPENVLLEEGVRPRLTDFGIVRLQEGQHSGALTQTGALLGTPAYWSPEQACGQPSGPPSDVYSLAASLHLLLTGRPLFAARTMIEAAVAARKTPPPLLRALLPDAPPRLESLLQRCLAKDPAARPSAPEVLEALEAVFEPPRARRAPWVGVAAGLALGALLGAVALARIAPSSGDASPPPSLPSVASLLRAAELAEREGRHADARAAYRGAAARGARTASARLGDMAREGRGGAQDLALARASYEDALAAHPEVRGSLGEVLLALGEVEAGRARLREAALAGDGLAAKALGDHLSAEPAEAEPWLRAAAAAGVPGSALAMARLVERRAKSPDDLREAAGWFRRAAERDPSVEAEVDLARLRWKGRGCERDVVAAERVLRRHAEAGDLRAMTWLGSLLRHGGLGVEPDPLEAVRWLRRAAAGDQAEAMLGLGLCYQYGDGVEPDLEVARSWLDRAVDLGSAEAMNNLGLLLIADGRASEESQARGLKLLERAAAGGYLDARANLAQAHLNGWGTAQDEARGVELFARAAELGSPRGVVDFGLLHLHGRGVARDPRRAAELFLRASQLGDALGTYLYAECLAKGLGLSVDEAAAFRWYEQSAREGYPNAFFHVARRHELGKGTAQDGAQARSWYARGAQLGNRECMHNLGLIFEFGRGVPADAARAEELYRRAIALGEPRARLSLGRLLVGLSRPDEGVALLRRAAADLPEAANYLGVAYLNGVGGVQADEAESARWFKRAAEGGFSPALSNYGLLLLRGAGVPADAPAAARLFRQGAELGDPVAMLNLALCFSQGEGVSRDDAEALAWFRKGAEGGESECMTHVGLFFQAGRGGLARDEAQAAEWFLRAARRDSAAGMLALGEAYETGRGVARDLAVAKRWFEQGLARARNDRLRARAREGLRRLGGE